MKHRHAFALALLITLSGASAQTPPVPEPPAIWREVTGVVNTYPNGVQTPVHSRPHVPAFRTTRDGRIGMRVISGAGFALMMPEKLTAPVRPNVPTNLVTNSYVMSSTAYKYVDGSSANNNHANFYTVPAGSKGGPGHITLFDPTPEIPTAGEVTNPSQYINPANGESEDLYKLKVCTAYSFDSTSPVNPGKLQIFVTSVEVYVAKPKTSAATIRSVLRIGTPVGGPLLGMGSFFEVNVVGDGRLIVMRGAGITTPWTEPDSGILHPAGTQSFNICYSYYTGGQAADPAGWSNIIPITWANNDSRINTKFGFAMSPFRDAAGTLITPGEDLGATYPWIDHDAKNLFFTVVSDTLRYRTGTSPNYDYSQGRYPQRAVPGEALTFNAENAEPNRGICFAGLWSHGKTVMVDNLNNDMDYAMGNGSELGIRDVKLFDSSLISPPMSEWLRLGAGRVNSDPAMPLGDNRNSSVIDSLQNVFNYRKYAKPITVRDVVWPLHNGKNTDDLVFDDYVDHDGFIVANMAGLATFDSLASTKTGGNAFEYANGWNNTTHTFSDPVKLQNAATATNTSDTSPEHRWAVPSFGLVIGTTTPAGRLEPAATGGIHGKGFWMTGNNGLQFTVPAQPQSVASHDWYAGIFVDCRFDDDNASRVLLTFPDLTSIRLLGRHQLQYINAAGTLVRSINLPAPNGGAFSDMLPDMGWAHLAWQIRSGGTGVDFLLNGLTYDRYTSTSSLFQLTPGKLTVGRPTGSTLAGFRGWTDDFIVLAHSVDPETACNHAGGTLVGLRASYTTGPLLDFAARFPASTHTEISNRLENSGETPWTKYANVYDYTQDDGVQLATLPANTVSLRASIHFPEGPLYYNRPRPDSTKNSFCITCHSVQGKGGLDLMALELIPGLNADLDDRRQPSQPFRRLFGNIPAGLVDNTSRTNDQPTSATVAPAAGKLIDDWVQSSFGNVVTVKTFTLVDAVNNVDLATLKNGNVVNRAAYGATSYAIRANVDYAQGDVTLVFDGGASVTRDRIPYSITPASFAPGSHTITATPQLGGAPVTITFTVQ